jgi:hypothetical protein
VNRGKFDSGPSLDLLLFYMSQAVPRDGALGKGGIQGYGGETATTARAGRAGARTGFGKFYVREQKAREGVNPQTKEKMRIPAQKVPSFSAGQGLKEAV